MQSLRPIAEMVNTVPVREVAVASVPQGVELAEYRTTWAITAEDFEAAGTEPSLGRLFMERAEREINVRTDAAALRAIRLWQGQAERGPDGFWPPAPRAPRPVEASAAPSPEPKSAFERLMGKSIID